MPVATRSVGEDACLGLCGIHANSEGGRRAPAQCQAVCTPYVSRKKERECFFGWVFFLILFGGQAPHVLGAHMGVHHTCGEPT